MSLITRMLKQKAVYWAPGSEATGGHDFDDHGKPAYASPVEVSCRWVDVVEEFIGPNETRELSRSKVYVDRDVRTGGVLWLGLLINVGDLVTPKNNDGAWEIRHSEKLPNLKATEFLRTAYL